MRWIFHPLRFVVCLLLIGISLYKIFPVPVYVLIPLTVIFIITFFILLKNPFKKSSRFKKLCHSREGGNLDPRLRGDDSSKFRDDSSKFRDDSSKFRDDSSKFRDDSLKRDDRLKISFSALAILFLGFSLISVELAQLDSPRSIANFAPDSKGRSVCEGTVKDVRTAAKKSKLVLGDVRCLKGDGLEPLAGRLRLTIPEPFWFIKTSFVSGDLIRFQTYLKRPRDFKNFNRPVFENYCMSRGIAALGYVVSPAWAVKVGHKNNFFRDTINNWRGSVRRAALLGLGNTDEFQLIKALILGDMSGFDEDELEVFKILGVIHILVVSGLHVAILAGLCWWAVVILGSLFSPFFGQRDLRRAASIISLILIWLFIALTGFGIPAVRSGVIASIYLGSILLGKTHDPWDSLALAALIILILKPAALFDASFQLTFAAVAGILVCGRFLLVAHEIRSDLFARSAYFLANMGIISIGASLGVYPLLAYHFGRVPMAGPVTSAILSPFATVAIVPISLIAALVTPLSTGSGVWIFGLTEWPSWLFINISKWLAAHLNWSVLNIEFDLLMIFALYIVIIILIYWREVGHKKIFLPAALILFGSGLFMTHPFGTLDGKLMVTFLDVGQGASVFVRTPAGKVTLIDGGGIKGSEFDMGKSVIEPFLKKAGVKEIDRLVVTHPHPDHFKGVGYIVDNFRPGIFMSGSYPGDDVNEEDEIEWNELLQRVKNAQVDTKRLEPALWEEGGVEFKVYSPPREIPAGWNVNDASGVIGIKFGDISFLITGDIEYAAESYLLENTLELKSTVLQIPHHGSKTSSSVAFLDVVSPKYSVIQVGAFNNYGFPQKDVLARLDERGMKIYRTDIDGAITFITDGKELKIFSAADF